MQAAARADCFAAYSVAVEKLLERERELAAVDELVARGGVVLVEGRAGIGKTALLEAACRRAAGLGREILGARGSELEAGFAFGAVRQLFERRLASADETERAGFLAGSAGAVRSRLLGEPLEPSAFDTSFSVLLHESVASLRRSPALLELAHSLTELGAALRRAGERNAGGERLAEALELAARCGARRLAARAREELRATGARPRREWRTGVAALTPSELRVVRLAAEGRTNREIAHELYVTLKTVEGHLSRAYTKLGIKRRAELPQVLEPEKTRVPTP